MITLESGKSPKIIFTGFAVEKKMEAAEDISFPLVYGHTCTHCGNVVQALFLTDSEFGTKPYEEIQTMSKDKDGNLQVIKPGLVKHAKSKYSRRLVARGDKVYAQLMRLDQHFPTKELDEHPICPYRCFFSFREDLTLMDVAAYSTFDPRGYNVPVDKLDSIKDELSKQDNRGGGARKSWVFEPDAAGRVAPAWMVSRDQRSWVLFEAIGRYRK